MRNSLFCLLLVTCLPVAGAEIKLDFGTVPAGQLPEHFHSALAGTGAPGTWQMVMDEVPSAFPALSAQATSLSRHGVLAQTSQDPADEHFPMLIYDGETFKDFKLTTQFKIVSGVAEQMAGIVFRYQNSSNFYVIRASALGHNVRFYKVVNGLRSDPIGPILDISTGTWHKFAVQCQGNQILCWLDGQPVMPALTDNTFAEGKVGFWTMSDAVSYFGNTTIDYTPVIPAAQLLVNRILADESRLVGLRIYVLNAAGEPKIIASKVAGEIGQPGTDAEKNAINNDAVFFGRDIGNVLVTLPFHDRNGDPIAAVRVEMKSFFGETQDTAVTRATVILKKMEAQITSAEDLRK